MIMRRLGALGIFVSKSESHPNANRKLMLQMRDKKLPGEALKEI